MTTEQLILIVLIGILLINLISYLESSAKVYMYKKRLLRKLRSKRNK